MWARHREVYESLPSRVSFLRRVMTVDLRVYLPGLGLAYVDRAGMEFGVEIRVPWLDLDFVKWSLALPESMLIRHRLGKWLPRAVASKALSQEIAYGPKRGFGAPSHRIHTDHPNGSGRGFRQDRYETLARRLLDQHRQSIFAPVGTTAP
jgi:asparagine synthase (glutamine-hydrolysing)